MTLEEGGAVDFGGQSCFGLTSIKAPIAWLWVDVEVLDFSKTLIGIFVMCSADWAFSLLRLLW